MASVWWQVGPQLDVRRAVRAEDLRAGGVHEEACRIEDLDVAAPLDDVLDDEGRLRQVRAAGDIRDDAPGRVESMAEASRSRWSAARWARLRASGASGPRGGGAALRARCRVRRPEPGRTTPARSPRSPGRRRCAPRSGPQRRLPRRREGLADQLGAVRGDLVGDEVGARLQREPGEQTGLAAWAGTQVEPALGSAGRLDGRRRHGQRDQLGTLVLDGCSALTDCASRLPDLHPASRTAVRASGAWRPRPSSAASSSSTVASPGRADKSHRRRLVVAVQQRLQLRAHRGCVAAPWPSRAARSARTTHSGWLVRSASAASGSVSSGTTAVSHCSRVRSDTRRSTALTNPAAPAPLT